MAYEWTARAVDDAIHMAHPALRVYAWHGLRNMLSASTNEKDSSTLLGVEAHITAEIKAAKQNEVAAANGTKRTLSHEFLGNVADLTAVVEQLVDAVPSNRHYVGNENDLGLAAHMAFLDAGLSAALRQGKIGAYQDLTLLLHDVIPAPYRTPAFAMVAKHIEDMIERVLVQPSP